MTDIDKANAEFWDELCGSSFAKYLGITDHGIESLKRFDAAYLDLYPYLLEHVNLEHMKGKRVIEVGLGYGTLGQKIAESGADYTGMDIAGMPVKMMKHRLQMLGLSGKAIRGSLLRSPIQKESFDCFVSIGCFHHTGNVQQCVDEAYRILKPGGKAFIMVYNQFSYRQWFSWPKETCRALLRDLGLVKEKIYQASEGQRMAYDADLTGRVAPETVFLSIRQLQTMFGRFSHISFRKENCTDLYISNYLIPRNTLLPFLGRTLGLDIYIQAQK